MFKPLVRYTFVVFIWRRYGRMILATVCLFVFFWLVTLLHEDYLAYRALNPGSGDVGLSFVMKWCAFATGVGLYFVALAKWRRAERPPPPTAKPMDAEPRHDQPDPFDTLRHSDTLRSRSDMIIEKYPPKKKPK